MKIAGRGRKGGLALTPLNRDLTVLTTIMLNALNRISFLSVNKFRLVVDGLSIRNQAYMPNFAF
jgi:hypothetical protein